MSSDLHIKSFTEETKTKLLIFQYYLREWLPVFLSKKEIIWKNINIIDFFAGPGYDVEKNEGSPLLIIDEINKYIVEIKSKRISINLIFNEYSKSKYSKLQDSIRSYNRSDSYSLTIENLDFTEAFNKYYNNIKCSSSANLIFLDQSGIKQITEEIFLKIISCKQTDFIFFISSSTIKRFSEHYSVQKYFDLSVKEIQDTPYHKIHKKILEFYKRLIVEKAYYLAPFSLKKGANIYGLIFGSHHILGMEKFLTTAWKIDPERGEANFDIDEEGIINNQVDLFTGQPDKPRKTEVFENELEKNILNKKLTDNRQIYIYTITQGFLPTHARKVLKQLIAEKLIRNKRVSLSYDVYKNPNLNTPIQL